MFLSVRANFDSSPFIAHFHALSPRFSSSHRSSGSIAVPHRDRTAKLPTAIAERLIYYTPRFARCSCHFDFQLSRNTPYIRIILPTALKKYYAGRVACVLKTLY